MGTEMVFSDGHRVWAKATNAETLTRTLHRANSGEEIRLSTGQRLAPGWIDIETEEEGVIFVNPAQIAYVRDVPDQEPLVRFGK